MVGKLAVLISYIGGAVSFKSTKFLRSIKYSSAWLYWSGYLKKKKLFCFCVMPFRTFNHASSNFLRVRVSNTISYPVNSLSDYSDFSNSNLWLEKGKISAIFVVMHSNSFNMILMQIHGYPFHMPASFNAMPVIGTHCVLQHQSSLGRTILSPANSTCV